MIFWIWRLDTLYLKASLYLDSANLTMSIKPKRDAKPNTKPSDTKPNNAKLAESAYFIFFILVISSRKRAASSNSRFFAACSIFCFSSFMMLSRSAFGILLVFDFFS